jgi:hypothetical protein
LDTDRGEDAVTDKIKFWLQEIEDMLRYKLVWDPKTKKFKKMIVYKEGDLNRKHDGKPS